MPPKVRQSASILCPSVTEIGPDAEVFGVLTASEAGEFRVGYLTEALPATPELLAAVTPAKPTEVFRAASPCMERRCKHFDGTNCQLAARVASMFDAVVSTLPRCAIRPRCRWFRQEGRAACRRCPQVATEQRNPTDLQSAVAG